MKLKLFAVEVEVEVLADKDSFSALTGLLQLWTRVRMGFFGSKFWLRLKLYEGPVEVEVEVLWG